MAPKPFRRYSVTTPPILTIVTQQIKRRAGILGAFGYSGANFVLTFALQLAIPAGDFGLFAFALVCIQFGISLSNALFAAPIVVSLVHAEDNRLEIIGSYFRANLLFIGLGALALATALFALGMSSHLILVVIFQAAALWLRWFFRAVELAEQRFAIAAMTDFIYGIVALCAGGIFFLLLGVDEFNTLCAMAAGALASALLVGRDMLPAVFYRSRSALRLYSVAFLLHGRWALLGVVTTEVMANLHVYALTLFLGPSSFAPVATLSLFFRSIPILMQAITQYERPVLARAFKERDLIKMRHDVRNIHAILNCAVGINVLGIALLIVYFPSLIGNGQYPQSTLWPVLILLALGQLVRGQRTGSSAALQGAGQYQSLAFVTVKAAPVTLLGTVLAIFFGWQAVASVLFAVLVGEVVTFVLINQLYRKMLTEEVSS